MTIGNRLDSTVCHYLPLLWRNGTIAVLEFNWRCIGKDTTLNINTLTAVKHRADGTWTRSTEKPFLVYASVTAPKNEIDTVRCIWCRNIYTETVVIGYNRNFFRWWNRNGWCRKVLITCPIASPKVDCRIVPIFIPAVMTIGNRLDSTVCHYLPLLWRNGTIAVLEFNWRCIGKDTTLNINTLTAVKHRADGTWTRSTEKPFLVYASVTAPKNEIDTVRCIWCRNIYTETVVIGYNRNFFWCRWRCRCWYCTSSTNATCLICSLSIVREFITVIDTVTSLSIPCAVKNRAIRIMPPYWIVLACNTTTM